MSVWLNADGVAERIGVSRRTALSLMYQMPHVVVTGTVKKRIRVSENTLEAWMLKHSTGKMDMTCPSTGSKRKLKRREV